MLTNGYVLLRGVGILARVQRFVVTLAASTRADMNKKDEAIFGKLKGCNFGRSAQRINAKWMGKKISAMEVQTSDDGDFNDLYFYFVRQGRHCPTQEAHRQHHLRDYTTEPAPSGCHRAALELRPGREPVQAHGQEPGFLCHPDYLSD